MENIENYEIKSLKVKTISIILNDYFQDIENGLYYTGLTKIQDLRMLLNGINALQELESNLIAEVRKDEN